MDYAAINLCAATLVFLLPVCATKISVSASLQALIEPEIQRYGMKDR